MAGYRCRGMHMPALLVVAVLLCMASTLPSGASAFWPSTGRHNPNAMEFLKWRMAAEGNVSVWRSTLWKRVMEKYKANIKASIETNPTGVGLVSAREYGVEPPYNTRDVYAELAAPFMTCPPSSSLTKVGGTMLTTGFEDGYKYVCGVQQLHAPCLVLSLGSNDETSFERAILDQTPCEIATFDCTVKKDVTPLADRHKFHKKCIGSPSKAASNPDFITWSQAVQMTNHSKVDLLKMDIEGFEFDVLAELGELETHLPAQIALEIHAWDMYAGTSSQGNAADFSNLLWPKQRLTLSQMALFLMHFANMGYGIVSKDDNPHGTCCTEITFLRPSGLHKGSHPLSRRML